MVLPTSAGCALGLEAICSFSASCLAFSSSSFRRLSSSNCLIRSASTCALRSASSKLMGAAAFFAPKPPNFDFLAPAAPPEDVLVTELDDVNRDAPSLLGRPAAGDDVERNEDDEIVRGAGDAMEVAEEAAEGVRPMIGGEVGADEGAGVLGFEAGLSQDEKKSSSSAWAEGVGAASIPSTNNFVGNLCSIS